MKPASRQHDESLGGPPPGASTAAPRVSEVVAEIGRATRWLADQDLGDVPAGELLGAVEALAPITDRLTHVQVEALAAAQEAIPEREGLLPDAWLQVAARRAGADRRTLLVAAEVLPTLPCVRAAARRGLVSWSEVRQICLRAARLSHDDRGWLDGQLAGDPVVLERRGADQVLETLWQALDDLDPGMTEDHERREFAGQFMTMSPRLDGTGTFYADLDAVIFTDVTTRVADLAQQLPTQPDASDDTPRWQSKGLRQALALHALVTGDSDGSAPSAKLLVTVDTGTLHPDSLRRLAAGGGLDDVGLAEAVCDTGGARLRAVLHHRRGRRAISQRQLRRLLAGAVLRPLLTADGVALKAGRTRRYASTVQRDAACALYGGCAWPACPAPFHACELHHVIAWHPPHHGRTDDDNLVPLCGIHHHAITHGKWNLELHRDRTVEVSRGRRRHRSIPRARASAHTSTIGGSDPPGGTDPPGDPPGDPPARVGTARASPGNGDPPDPDPTLPF